MIAAREQVELEAEELLGDLGSDAETGGGVLDVGDAEVDAVLLDDLVQAVVQQPSTRFAEDVADEQDSHGAPEKGNAPALPCGMFLFEPQS